MQANQDYILVHIPSRYSTDVLGSDGKPMLGCNGIALVNTEVDQNYTETLGATANIVTVGTVVSVCEHRTTGERELLIRGGKSDHRRVSQDSIVDQIQVGQTVQVEYLAVDDANELTDVDGHGTGIYAITYGNLIAVLDGDEIKPVGSYILCEPVYPVDVEFEEIEGQQVPVRKMLGFISEMHVPALEGQGRAVHVGQPLHNQPNEINPGDRLLFDHWAGSFTNKIRGRDYICVRQDNVAVVLNNTANVESLGESRLGFVSHRDPYGRKFETPASL